MNFFNFVLKKEVTENKETLRQQARAHLEHLPPDLAAPEEAAARFFEVLKPRQGQVVAGYWPNGKEYDVRYILDDLLKEGVTCALPVVQKDSLVLGFHKWDEDVPLEKGAFGIMEPQGSVPVDPDIVLVPLMAFDRRGYRLGHGGGYYDATLAALRAQKDILAAGVGYSEQAVLFPLPVEEHDQRLDLIVTPGAVHDFRK